LGALKDFQIFGKKIAAYNEAPGVLLETEFLAETLTINH